MDFLKTIWRGEASLGFTFWGLGIILLFILRIFEYATANISPAAGLAGFLFSILYYTFYSVVLWRTAGNENTDVMYANLLRGFLLLGWGRYLISAKLVGAEIT